MASKSRKIYHRIAPIAEDSDSDQNLPTENNTTPSQGTTKQTAHVISSDDDEEIDSETDRNHQTLTEAEENMTAWSNRLRKRRSVTPIAIVSDDEEESEESRQSLNP